MPTMTHRPWNAPRPTAWHLPMWVAVLPAILVFGVALYVATGPHSLFRPQQPTNVPAYNAAVLDMRDHMYSDSHPGEDYFPPSSDPRVSTEDVGKGRTRVRAYWGMTRTIFPRNWHFTSIQAVESLPKRFERFPYEAIVARKGDEYHVEFNDQWQEFRKANWEAIKALTRIRGERALSRLSR